MPIFLTSVFDMVASTTVLNLVTRGVLSDAWVVYSLIFSLPACLVVLKDARAAKRARFSLAHGMFLAGVLYRLNFKAARIDVWIWDQLTAELAWWRYAEAAVPLLTMVAHLGIFVLVRLREARTHILAVRLSH